MNTVGHSRSPKPARKRSSSSWLHTVGWALIIVLVVGLCGTAILRTRAEYTEARAEYEQIEAEVKRLQRENERLREEIRALKSDPQVIERIAREELHMIRPDEMVLSFPPSRKK